MLSIKQSVLKSEVLRNWGRAEADSTRFGENYSFPPETLRKLSNGLDSTLTADEWFDIECRVSAVREPLLSGLEHLGVKWEAAELPIDDVEDLQFLNCEPYTRFPTRRLGDFIKNISGASRADGFQREVREMATRFSLERMRGAPILVSDGHGGHLTILEGTLRVSSLGLRRVQGDFIGVNLPIYVGTCERALEWRLGNLPTGSLLYWKSLEGWVRG